jgi:hypothetical protein
VKNEISKLLDKINCGKPKRFLKTAERDQLQELEKEGNITIEKFNKYAEDFYDTCIEYIQELCSSFLMLLQPMNWINLKGKVTCTPFQVNYVFMQTMVPDLSLNEDDLFDKFSCVEKYVNAN